MSNFKQLEGWVSVAGAANILGMSRQAVHSRIGRGSFNEESVRVVGTGNDERPFYLISEDVVKALASELNPTSL